MGELAETIREGVWRITLPFRFGELREINVYLFRLESGGYLLFDTGSGWEDSVKAFEEALGSLEVEKSEIELVLLSHHHIDHSGGSGWIKRESGARILIHHLEAELIKSYRELIRRGEVLGTLSDALGADIKTLESILRTASGMDKVRFDETLEGGESYKLESGVLRVIETPGHSPGHISLFLEEGKILFSGDVVLERLVPNIAYYPIPGYNSLRSFLQTLEKIERLNPLIIYPSHGQPIKRIKERLAEMREYHLNRLREVREIVGREKDISVIEIAKKIKWEKGYYDELPPGSKLLALLETEAYIQYLEEPLTR